MRMKETSERDRRACYEAPAMEVIEVGVEKGFAATGSHEGFGENDYQW